MERVVYIEHPIREKWAQSEQTQKPVEKTAAFYRFRVDVKRELQSSFRWLSDVR